MDEEGLRPVTFLIHPIIAAELSAELERRRRACVTVQLTDPTRSPVVLFHEAERPYQRELAHTLWDDFDPNFHQVVHVRDRGWGVFARELPGDESDGEGDVDGNREEQRLDRQRFRHVCHDTDLPLDAGGVPIGEAIVDEGRVYRAKGTLTFVGSRTAMCGRERWGERVQ